MLAQTEIERVKFVVRSYVRTRLSKVSHIHRSCESLITESRQIEDYARWILSNASLHGRLSETELKHAQRYEKQRTLHPFDTRADGSTATPIC